MTPQFKTIVDKHKFNKLAAIGIGVALSVPLLFVSFLMFQNVVTRASSDVPRDVVITNITDTSAQISWTTDQESADNVVEYGTSPTNLVFFAPDFGGKKSHTIDLNLLTPKTAHYFQIKIKDKVYDNGGVPWTFTTRVSASDSSGSLPSATPSATISRPVVTGVTGTYSLPSVTQAPSTATCNETDCQKIKARLNEGCTASDYIRCIQRAANSPTATPTAALTGPSPTPTNAPPTVGSLISPTTTTPQPTFSFTLSDSNSTDTVRFQIQIDDNQDFTSPVTDYTSGLGSTGSGSFRVGQTIGTGSYASTGGQSGQMLANGSYYWRVRAVDSKGAASGFSVANGGNVAFTVN